MKINKQELIEALDIVRPGLASKEMLEQTTSFAFMGGRIVTYNDEISISHPIKDLNLTGAIKAEELYKLLSKMKDDKLEITVNGPEIHVKSGKSKAGFTLQEKVLLPLEEIGEQGEWKKIPDNLLACMRFAMFSCGKDMSEPKFTCVNVRKDGCIESCDNMRVTRSKANKLPKDMSTFMVPAISVRELVKYEMTKMAEGQGWVHFKNDAGTIFSCRIFEKDEFPNVSKLLQVKGASIKLPKTIGDVLDRAAVFAKRDHALDENVTITLGNNKMKVKGQNSTGWFEEECNVRYKDQPISFIINPSFLKEILSHVQTCTLGKDRMKFEGDDWEHVVSLCIQEG